MLALLKSLTLFVAITASIAVLWLLHIPEAKWLPTSLGEGSTDQQLCNASLQSLENAISLPETFEYAKKCIWLLPNPNLEQASTVDVDATIFSNFQTLNLGSDGCEVRQCTEHVTIEYAPELNSQKASTLMLGAATTLERFEHALPYIERWLAHSGAALVVIIQGVEDHSILRAAESEAQELGIDVKLIPDSHFGIDREITTLHFLVVQAFQEHRRDEHEWFAVIDDDTFFTSLSAVMGALSTYDPQEPWYIGALTESQFQINVFGYMAFGGAGIFLSRPAMEMLYEHREACASSDEGDVLFMRCLSMEVSPPVQLTILSGLHQIDLRGDPDGWYEGGLKPILSVHHYDGWHHVPVHYAHLVTDLCGHDCFLQRYRFKDDTVITNGFSAVQYPRGLASVDLGRIEHTFEQLGPGREHDYDSSFGKMRPKLTSQEKISWKLEYAMREDSKAVRQFYVRRNPSNDVEAVLQIEWAIQK